MKKLGKSCLVLLIVLVILLIAGVAAMAAFDLCPPEGPWPAPPWCDGSETPLVINPQDVFPDIGPSLTFNVEVPENTPAHTTVFIEIFTESGEAIVVEPMEQTGEYEWTFSDTFAYTFLQLNGSLQYRYTRNNFFYMGAEEFEVDSPDSFRTITKEDDTETHDVVAKWRWIPEVATQIPSVDAHLTEFVPRVDGIEFQGGVVWADWWWDTFEPLLESSNERLLEHSINWVEIAAPWDYTQVNPVPVFSNAVGHAYPDDKIKLHLGLLQEDGFSVLLQPQICCTSLEDAVFTDEWWDAWFENYREFLLYHAELANQYGVEYFLLGGTDFVYDQQPEGYKDRLDEIFDEVQEVYGGQLGYMLFLGGNQIDGIHDFYPELGKLPSLDRWDFLAISFWVGISDSNAPTLEELDANLEEIFSTRIDPLYAQYGKPVILNQVAYASVDGGLMGMVDIFDPATLIWEPYSDKFQLDLEEQALGFDAVMRAVASREYVIGMYAFSYLPDTYPLTLEFNIRDKPCEEVLSQWFQSIP